jgi:putative chitinase
MTILASKYKKLLDNYGVNTPLRLAHFFAQAHHESGLKPISENLNYSAKGLLKTFPKYFTTEQLSNQYSKQAVLIANRVYANRMGNGDEKSGDGYNYRGRGFFQITGKENYQKLSNDTGIDFVSSPHILLTEANSMLSALWYWNKINGNKLADKNDIKGITKAINGGYNGMHHREQLLIKYKDFFGA